jgi:hypothetical protein
MAINRFTNAAGGNTWGTAGNWSQGTVPTANDGHVTTFDATSPNCTVNASNRVCNNIDFTGYTNTITMTFIITVSGNITFSSGMIVAGSAVMQVNATSTMSGTGWTNGFTVSATCTITLSSNVTITGTFTVNLNVTATVNWTTSEILRIGGLTQSGLNAVLGGTAEVRLTGGTWVCSTSGGVIGSRTFGFDGAVTINGTCNLPNGFTGTLKWYSGTLLVSGSTVQISDSCTIDFAGGILGGVTFSGSSKTFTINSLLTCATITFGGTTSNIIAGTAGFTCDTLNCTQVTTHTVTLKEAITYTITTAFNCYTSRVGASVLFTSAHASTKAILTLVNPSSCNVLANFTRIDASGGRTINTFNGTLTDCTNVRSFHDRQTANI